MKYERILLKLSGESLGGGTGRGINEDVLAEYSQQIADLAGKCGELSRDGVSCLDLDRSQRCGFPEFVFGSGKSLPVCAKP